MQKKHIVVNVNQKTLPKKTQKGELFVRLNHPVFLQHFVVDLPRQAAWRICGTSLQLARKQHDPPIYIWINIWDGLNRFLLMVPSQLNINTIWNLFFYSTANSSRDLGL